MTVRRSLLMTCLLSLQVMAWGILPPALRHAHEGGSDASHRHSAQAGFDDSHHNHHHVHGEEHEHHRMVDAVSATAGNRVVHLHWALFGFDFAFPTRGQDDGPDDRQATGAVLVRLVDDLPAVIPRAGNVADLDSITLHETVVRVVCAGFCASRPSNRISALPLCDTARFERSGVLLA